MDPITFSNVWKRFNKGEKFNSLRDAIPNFLYKKVSRNNETLRDEEFWALKDVSFNVKKGEVVGIIGSNGAGKSTILKLLSGILVPNKGSLKINGRISALIEIGAGFHVDLTGRENVYLNGTILGMRKKEIDAKFDEIVEFSGVGEFIDTPVKRYSSGMYARLGFSVAAHVDPDVLLVDEVLAVGDLNFQAKCAQKMRSLLNTGTTIVLVSHNLVLVQSMCNRVILLDKGQIIKTGGADEVNTYYQNLAYKNQEEDIKKKIKKSDYKIRLPESSIAEISKLFFYSNELEPKDNLEYGEPLSIKIKYFAKEQIENPVFDIEINRPDGVSCCSVNTKNSGKIIKSISGSGEVTIDFGRIDLAPGIYMVKVIIWDKEMIHPFDIRDCDILKINTKGSILPTQSVFLPKVEWKFK